MRAGESFPQRLRRHLAEHAAIGNREPTEIEKAVPGRDLGDGRSASGPHERDPRRDEPTVEYDLLRRLTKPDTAVHAERPRRNADPRGYRLDTFGLIVERA